MLSSIIQGIQNKITLAYHNDFGVRMKSTTFLSLMNLSINKIRKWKKKHYRVVKGTFKILSYMSHVDVMKKISKKFTSKFRK